MAKKNKEYIEVRDPDDEIVGYGFFHVERMDKDYVWIGFVATTGEMVHLDLHSKKRIKMNVRDER